MTASPAIRIEALSVARGDKRVLHDVTLEIGPGEVTALVGRNGAGKSTLVATVCGILQPLSGGITVAGTSLAGLKPDAVRRLGVATVLEGQRILSGLSVLDNLRAAGSMLSRADLEAEVDKALALFPELRERLTVAGRSLSGGQRQMLAISQALIGRPDFLIIDELSLGLAPTVVKRLAAAIETIATGGVGILLIEQFTTLALAMAEDAYLIERGRIVFSGSSAELRDRPELLHSAYLAAGSSEARA